MQNLQVQIVTTALSDGDAPKELTIQTDNRDQVRWELARAREGWPAQTEAPALFTAYVAWSALARGGDLQGMKFADFQQTVIASTASLVDVDPTRAAPAAD